VIGADVVAHVGEQAAGGEAVLVTVGAGEAATLAPFHAELEEGVGGRQPFELDPFALLLAAEEGLVG